MNKIRIVTDSASDMNPDCYGDITVLSMAVRFGDEEFRDGIDLTPSRFYEKLIECDELPATSLIPPAVFESVFADAAQCGEEVIVITLSGALSGTYQSAVLAAEEYRDRVWVVDSRSVAVGEHLLVLRALALKNQGLSAGEIAATLEYEKERIHVLAVLDTLEYLKKGGRISAATALIGGALNIKPVVTVEDGAVKMLGKARGSKNGNNYLIKEIENTAGIDFTKPVCLGFAGLTDALLRKYMDDSQYLWADHRESLVIAPIGATIGTHVGPGAIAIAFVEKE